LKHRSSATLAGFCAILLWSALALLTTATGAVPPFQLTAMTFAIGGLAGLAVLISRGEARVLWQRPAAWLLGVGGLFSYHALYFAALRSAPPAEAGLVNHLWPLLLVLFSALLPGERLHLRHVLGAAIGFGGLVVLFVARDGGFSALSTGHVLALGAGIVWASYSLLSRRLADVPSGAVAGFCLVTALLAAILHAATEATVWPVGAAQWLALAALGLGPVGAAFFLWDHGVKRGDIRLIGVLSYAAPVLSTLWLVVLGYAEPGWPLAAACGMIVAGALVASRRSK
jgi:drug/metabolite transporter (DMT)-like permease